jgi:hypothetical protein
MHPNFYMSSISLVSNRNNLRKLFNFASNHLERSFRIDVQIVSDTMFFKRWEQGSLYDSGYGHSFEKAFTTFDDDLENSYGHHRIAQYNLGGMNCIVSFKADAYFDESPDSTAQSPSSESPPENPDKTDNDLSATFTSLSLAPKENDTEHAPQKGVRVIQRGRLVSPASVIEVKSRRGLIKMNEVIPQLWFSQTEHLFVGYHRDGLVEEEVTHYEMAEHFKAWEIQNEEQLQKLVVLILKIREAVQGTKDRKCVIFYDHHEKPRRMWVYEADKDSCPELVDVEKKCWTGA